VYSIKLNDYLIDRMDDLFNYGSFKVDVKLMKFK